MSKEILREQFDSQNDQAKYKDQNTYPVDPVHITNLFCFRLIGIGLPDIEILTICFKTPMKE